MRWQKRIPLQTLHLPWSVWVVQLVHHFPFHVRLSGGTSASKKCWFLIRRNVFSWFGVMFFTFWTITLTLQGPGFPWLRDRASWQEVMFRVVGPVGSPGSKKILAGNKRARSHVPWNWFLPSKTRTMPSVMDDMIKETTSKRDQHIFHTKKPCQCYQPEFPLSKPNGNNIRCSSL